MALERIPADLRFRVSLPLSVLLLIGIIVLVVVITMIILAFVMTSL